jgi:hypothetical protein
VIVECSPGSPPPLTRRFDTLSQVTSTCRIRAGDAVACTTASVVVDVEAAEPNPRV